MTSLIFTCLNSNKSHGAEKSKLSRIVILLVTVISCDYWNKTEAEVLVEIAGSAARLSIDDLPDGLVPVNGETIELEGDSIKLDIIPSFGIFSFNAVSEEETNENYESFEYDSAPLAMSFKNKMWVIAMPSVATYKFSAEDRTYNEQRLSFWLGLFSYWKSTHKYISGDFDGTNIGTERIGLTTSQFAKSYRNLARTAFNNPALRKKTKSLFGEGCKKFFFYISGNIDCTKNAFRFVAAYGFGYDYYYVKTDLSGLVNGSGTGFSFGGYALVQASYAITNKFSIGLGADFSSYSGKESISYPGNQERKFSIGRDSVNVSFSVMVRL